jgi:hypothetical protein
MQQEDGSPDSHGTLDSFDKRTGFQPFRYFALLGMTYGIVVGACGGAN